MVGWHHRLKGHELEQTPGASEGQGSLVCCGPWGHKEWDKTEWLNDNNCDCIKFTSIDIFCILYVFHMYQIVNLYLETWLIRVTSDRKVRIMRRGQRAMFWIWEFMLPKLCFMLLTHLICFVNSHLTSFHPLNLNFINTQDFLTTTRNVQKGHEWTWKFF